MLSNGTTQAITSGWLSDTPSVATVTSAGVVTGVANGLANIYVVAGGAQGLQQVRVVPDYQGRWVVSFAVTSCTETGVFAAGEFCTAFPVGSTGRALMDLSHSGPQVTAAVDYGGGLVFAPVSTPIREDGSLNFNVAASVTEEGLTLNVNAGFTLNSTRVGELTGTNTDVYTLPNINGEARVSYNVVAASRSVSGAGAPGPSKAGAMRLSATGLRVVR